MRHLTAILLVLCCFAAAWARETADSVVGSAGCASWLAPAAAVVAQGTLARFTAPQPNHPGQNLLSGEGNSAVTEAARFLPALVPWVAKAAGAETSSSWGRMAASQAIGAALLTGFTEGIKRGADAPRPDGEDRRGFPSGHAAVAFFGATTTAIELTDASPWYAFGAYTFATGVAVERVVSNRHLPADVMAGAGIGVISAELGYLVGDMIFGPRHAALSADFDLRNYVSLSSGLAWPVGHISIGHGKITRLPALEAGVRGGGNLTDRWGLWAFAGFRSQPLQLDMPVGSTYVGCLNSIALLGGAQWEAFSTSRLAMHLEAGGGYYRNLNIRSIDHAVRAGSGTLTARLGLGLTWRLAEGLSCRGSAAYEVSHYRFDVSPSEAYFTNEAAKSVGTTSALLATLSIVVSLN